MEFNDWQSALEGASAQDAPFTLIEGGESVGKTPFAADLSKRTGALVLSLDKFIRPGAPTSRYEQLVDRGALAGAIHGARKPVVIEGVCLRKIVPGDVIAPATSIYLRRVTPAGLWHLEENLVGFDFAKSDLCVEAEVLQYHLEFAPQRQADFLVTLLEGDAG